MTNMELQYVYTKKRYEFGHPIYLHDEGPTVLETIIPNTKAMDDYILKNPAHSSVQCSKLLAEHEAMEHCILQNNSVNIYEAYFENIEETSLAEHSSARTVNVYRDICKPKRPVTHLSWSPDGGSHIAVTHCNLEFQRTPPELSTFSYIWEIENPNKPLLTLKPYVSLVSLEYNSKDPHGLVSGLFSGQVAIWDVRRGPVPVETSLLEASHRDPVHNVLWINSKSGAEFFSSSTDGQVKWWDTRKMAEPTETLILDPIKGEEQCLSRALGASCLEYEGTIPTRFMVGTESGSVISCNRKGKTPVEKIISRYSAHFGPVYAVQRNPAFVKNFMTIGDWTTRIWSEDCKESAIIWTSFHHALLTDGAWSPTRYSVFYTSRMDGSLDVWDILQQQREACLSVKVCDDPLRCLKINDQGQFIAVGSDMGTVYLVEISDNLVDLQKNDKPLLTAMLERESRREKILEARIREIRLKQKAKATSARDSALKDNKTAQAVVRSTSENILSLAEKEFYSTVEKEINVGKEESEKDIPVELDNEENQ